MRVLQSEHPRPLDVLAIGTGGHIAAGCSTLGVSRLVEVWNLATGAISYVRSAPEGIKSLAFTADGRFLLVAELREIGVLEIVPREPRSGPGMRLATVRLGHPAFAMSADSRRLLATEAWDQSGRVECWDVSDGPSLRDLWDDGPHASLWFDAPAVSSDGTRVAVIRRPQYGDRPQQTIQLRDGNTGRVLWEVPHDAADPVQQLAFTADGTKLLARFRGRTVRAFDTETGEPTGELVHKGRPFVTGLAVHPGGKVIATSRNDGTVWFWDPTTFRVLRSFDWKLGKLVSVAFSPDGSLAAAGTERGQVVVWDVDE